MTAKTKDAVAKPAKRKGKVTKGNRAAKSSKKEAAKSKSSAELTAQVEFAKEVKKADGPCEAVRATARKFKSLSRGEMLEVAKAARINKFTASRQFHLLRSGAV